MARSTGLSVAAAFSAVVALAAALTIVGVQAYDLSTTNSWNSLVSADDWKSNWADYATLAAAIVSAVAAAVFLLLQLCGCAGSGAAVFVAIVGTAAHLGALGCFIAWALTIIPGVNSFDGFSYWNTNLQVTFIFGCVIGAAAWLLALVLSAVDAHSDGRRRVGSATILPVAAPPQHKPLHGAYVAADSTRF